MLPSAWFQLVSKAWLLFTSVLYAGRGLLSYLPDYSPSLSPVIQTQDGPVQGKLGRSRGGQDYWQFLGIPYGKALRFQPPVPVTPWDLQEVKQVTRHPPACAQFDAVFLAQVLGKEDCLFLNVFTRDPLGSAPVLLYFHGGAFLLGETSWYHPTFLMDHPIVVVTVQYRLGPLGFLNLQEPDERYPRGNMGLKDQNLALKWVQRSIAAFGGDPNRISIMGDSAGSASVSFHMLSNASRGLFHRAIGNSGSALCPWAYTERPRDIAEKYAKRLGCSTKSSEDIWQCMLNMDVRDLVQLQWSWSNPSLEKDEFVPSLEPITTSDTFLTERPIRLMRSGQIANVPLITGIVSGEGSLRSARLEALPEVITQLERNWDETIGRVMFFDEDPVVPEIAQRLQEFYFDRHGKSLDRTSRHSVLQSLTDLTGDALFNEPVHTAAVEHARMGAPTYLFYFDYRSKLLAGLHGVYRAVHNVAHRSLGPFSLLQGTVGSWVQEKVLGGEATQRQIYGVTHGEHGLQIWDILGLTGGFVEADREFSEEFVKSLVGFVMGWEPSFRGVKWPKVDPNDLGNLMYMVMDQEGHGRVSLEPIQDRMKFWEELTVLRQERA